MTARDRLVALAALFAPDRAAAILARLAGPDAADAAGRAARLAAAPRRERLHALAAAIGDRRDALRAQALAAAGLERPRVAAALRRIAGGASDVPSPVLRRLCRERIDR